MVRDKYQIQLGTQVLTELSAPEWLEGAKMLARDLQKSVAVRRVKDHWPVCRVTADGRVIYF